MSTESPKTWFFWSGNALPDPPCYDQYTDDADDDDDDTDDDDDNDDDDADDDDNDADDDNFMKEKMVNELNMNL